MSQPSFLGDGTTPSVKDTRWKQWVKLLGQVQNSLASPSDSNNPTPHDTRWMLRRKLLKALTGT